MKTAKIKIAIITINQPSLDSGERLYKIFKDSYDINLYGKTFQISVILLLTIQH